MQLNIHGEIAQAATLTMEAGEVVWASKGSLMNYGPGIEWNLKVPGGVAGAAFFGGAGLFLQKISGTGTVLVHGSGDFQDVRLGAGEQLRASTGNLAAFAEAVDYDIERVGSLRKTLFGSEGFFMTRLQGPGRVLLQTLKRTSGHQGRGGPPPG